MPRLLSEHGLSTLLRGMVIPGRSFAAVSGWIAQRGPRCALH